MKYCERCGNELHDEAVFCPKCGCAVRYEKPQWKDDPSARVNVCALVGFILSLTSVIFIVNIFGILSVAGLVNSIIGLVNCEKKKQRGKGFAIAGVAVGAIFLIIGIITWVYIILDYRYSLIY